MFGLTTAIHLARRGYSKVQVLDKQPYRQTLYAYESGCDAASAGGINPCGQAIAIKLTTSRYKQDLTSSVRRGNRISESCSRFNFPV